MHEAKPSSVDDRVSECRPEDEPQLKSASLSRIPPSTTSPQSLRLPQLIYTDLYNYYAGSLEGGTWTNLDGIWDLVSTKAKVSPAAKVSLFLDRHYMACSLLDRGLFQEAGKALDQASAVIKDVLEAEIPSILPTLPILFTLISYPQMASRPELIKVVLKQFAGLARILFPGQHPMAQILKNLINTMSFGTANFEHVILMSLRCFMDALVAKLGPDHFYVLRLQGKFVEVLSPRYGIPRAEGILRKLIDRCKITCGQNDVRTLDLLGILSEILLKQGKCDEAAQIAKHILVNAPTPDSYWQSMSRRVSAFFLMARIHRAQRRPDMAIESLQQAIDLSISVLGISHVISNRFLLLMQDWLTALGYHDRAEQINGILRGDRSAQCDSHCHFAFRSDDDALAGFVLPQLRNSSNCPGNPYSAVSSVSIAEHTRQSLTANNLTTGSSAENGGMELFSMDLISNIRRIYDVATNGTLHD